MQCIAVDKWSRNRPFSKRSKTVSLNRHLESHTSFFGGKSPCKKGYFNPCIPLPKAIHLKQYLISHCPKAIVLKNTIKPMNTIFFQLGMGMLLGYIGATISESLVHRYVLHAPKSFITYWSKHPRLFSALLWEHYVHKIHHYRTFKKDHVTQFVSKEEQMMLDAYIDCHNDKDRAERLKKNKYGLFSQPKGILFVGGLTTIFFVIPYYFIFGAWVALGSMPFVYFLAYFMSRYIHPFAHTAYEVQIQSSSLLIRLLLRTPYFRSVIRYHYVHHKYIYCNYNLALGADRLFGWVRQQSEEDTEEMQQIGILTE